MAAPDSQAPDSRSSGDDAPGPDEAQGPAEQKRRRRPFRRDRDAAARRAERDGEHDAIAKAPAPNPPWFVPVMLGLMIVGLLWVVVYYLSEGRFPVPQWHNWNLLAGFGFIIVGFGMTTQWR